MSKMGLYHLLICVVLQALSVEVAGGLITKLEDDQAKDFDKFYYIKVDDTKAPLGKNGEKPDKTRFDAIVVHAGLTADKLKEEGWGAKLKGESKSLKLPKVDGADDVTVNGFMVEENGILFKGDKPNLEKNTEDVRNSIKAGVEEANKLMGGGGSMLDMLWCNQTGNVKYGIWLLYLFCGLAVIGGILYLVLGGGGDEAEDAGGEGGEGDAGGEMEYEHEDQEPEDF